ncbi:hypothetical protein EDB83DRAFT_933572 [Lactarius deliciosus]|nr:hypothetical protein EDB83DRAFT_436440 [Lactarius deliciosus]KAH9059458.1 hypothetical protein EDB83DRAFT_933572 [Lactarius deliciosus]
MRTFVITKVTLVGLIFLVFATFSRITLQTGFFRRRWLLPLSALTVRRNSVPSGDDLGFFPKQSAQPLTTLCPSANPPLHYRQIAKADPTTLLGPVVGGSMQSQIEAKLANMDFQSLELMTTMPSSPATRTLNTSANPNRQSLDIDSTSSFLSYLQIPDTVATLAQ